MNRAYSVLAVKAVDDGARTIRGTATTPRPDRVGDVVEPLGIQFRNPMPLLWQHRHDAPVGVVKFDKPTADGITFEATIPVIAEPGALKDRVDEAWQSVKAGLVAAVSIGFRPLEYSRLDDGAVRFLASEVVELSLVTIPMNADATISLIKSLDAEHLPVASDSQDNDVPPAAPGKKATRVVKLADPARDWAKPFVINRIVRS